MKLSRRQRHWFIGEQPSFPVLQHFTLLRWEQQHSDQFITAGFYTTNHCRNNTPTTTNSSNSLRPTQRTQDDIIKYHHDGSSPPAGPGTLQDHKHRTPEVLCQSHVTSTVRIQQNRSVLLDPHCGCDVALTVRVGAVGNVSGLWQCLGRWSWRFPCRTFQFNNLYRSCKPDLLMFQLIGVCAGWKLMEVVGAGVQVCVEIRW